MLDQFEELVGELNHQWARERVLQIITRLITVGFMPEEAILLTAELWDLSIEDACFGDCGS